MGIEEHDVIDAWAVADDGRLVLAIFDDYYWGPYSPDVDVVDVDWHALNLQSKMNTYVDAILSGSFADEGHDADSISRNGWVIRYYAYGPIPKKVIDFYWGLYEKTCEMGGSFEVYVTDSDDSDEYQLVPGSKPKGK
jgi:hypothetical protein